MCPLRGGLIEMRSRDYRDRMLVVTISGKDSSVFAAKDGKVDGCFIIGDIRAVMIYSGNKYYTYSELDTVFVAKGQLVKAGDIIGICPDRNLNIVISNTRGRKFPAAKFLDFRIVVIKPD
jgi:hypothetical protein